jgi:hypothetical protein
VRLDLVAVAAAVLLLHHVPGLSQIGDEVGAGTRGSAADGGQLPRGRWKERAMFLIILVVIVAVVMIVALPRILRKR